MSHRILRFAQEAVFGVFPTVAPVKVYIRCDTPNIFKPMLAPDLWTIQDGSGQNVPELRGSATAQVKGRLRTRLGVATAPTLLGLCGIRCDATGLVPWTTTEPATDLPSASIDFGWTRSDGSMKRQRALGCKVVSFQIESQYNETDPFVYLSMDLIGSVVQGNVIDASIDPTAIVFPEPGPSDLPQDYFYHRHCAGGVTIGSARTTIKKLMIKGTNKVRGYWDENAFANRVRCNGRTINFSADMLLKPSPNDRSVYEAVTNAGATSITYTRGANTMGFNFNGQNYFDNIEEDLILDEDNYFTLTGTNLKDNTAGNDGFTITLT